MFCCCSSHFAWSFPLFQQSPRRTGRSNRSCGGAYSGLRVNAGVPLRRIVDSLQAQLESGKGD
jgi:hypothetical protein